ncbi:Carboxylesterase 1E [Armadillidium nasatum]|uniref:Carboxylic ester hydrolase n=1 Tax=Armadillidium nasatum TaxID=96803 RepID=A0A5N5TM60_9CRUS|nr:Carboxylesterase 1E [Armadillidium nasatum]
MPNKEAKFPVMVYIHGGSFIGGKSSSYTGHVLLQEKIVLVTIQYRLGILGFLSTEDSIIPGNMGLKDQQLALKWVKENIVHFGGNPNAITLFGNSAGAASIHFQIFSPGSKDLFQRVILQSGNALCPWATSINHRNFAQDSGKKFGCELQEGTEENYLLCMQSIEARDLVQFTTDTGEWGVAPIYVLPRIDGDFLPDHPETLLKQKRYSKVDMIMGVTKDDGSIILGTMLINPLSMFTLVTNFSRNGPFSVLLHEEENAVRLAEEAYKFYLKRNNTFVTFKDVKELLLLCKDRYFGMCHDIALNFLSKENDTKVYVYEFGHFGAFSDANSVEGLDRKDLVIHGDDIYYFFEGSIPYHRSMKNQNDLLMREIMVTAWTNFASNGNPNSPEFEFKWEPFTGKNKRILKGRSFWSHLETRQNKRLNSTLNYLT